MLIDTCLIPFESKKHCFKTLNNNFQNCLYFHFRKFFQEFLVISSDSSQIVVISIRKELKEISVELSRIDDASEIDEELFTPIRTMLEILESFKNDEGNNREDIKMSRVIICANQKGGVAKTTSVVNIGIGLSRLGKKVLVIDNDPQGSLTEALGYPEPDKLEITLATIMEWRHLLSVL